MRELHTGHARTNTVVAPRYLLGSLLGVQLLHSSSSFFYLHSNHTPCSHQIIPERRQAVYSTSLLEEEQKSKKNIPPSREGFFCGGLSGHNVACALWLLRLLLVLLLLLPAVAAVAPVDATGATAAAVATGTTAEGAVALWLLFHAAAGFLGGACCCCH